MSDANLLAGQTSPYLLQHAANPVNWMPWGEEALRQARQLDRPILLSIGYSACHWCHVMAHESFEDEATAALMNASFINIKVDREERPDIDRIYQSAHQLLVRRSGGWPLTMFLTPDEHVPFFAGTYFPVTARYGMPSFSDVLDRAADYFRQHRNDIRGQRDAIVNALRSVDASSSSQDALNETPLNAARAQLEQTFDQQFKGFGDAPKFPHPSNIERLLRHHAHAFAVQRSTDDAHTHGTKCHGDEGALSMAIDTLHAIANGGIYDHLGGGFCRYSVDREWMIPHFEKMLYDNGPLLQLCAWALQLRGDERFREVCTQTADWVMRDMQHADGGYFSSLDADSEGEEGRFYVWTPQEVRSLLDDREYAPFASRFGLDRAANFEGKHWHLHGFRSVGEAASQVGMDSTEAAQCIRTASNTLLAARNQRIWPALDDKILASWNGLMIKGMSVAGRVLGREDWIASAQRALDFVRSQMMVDGRLQATSRNGASSLNAYLDDHALLIDATLSLLEYRWRDGDLDFALGLADALLERFHDQQAGGFFFTSHDHEQLLHRPKPMLDDALPCGNGVAARVLIRLGHLCGRNDYLLAAESTLRAGWESILAWPHAHGALLDALEEWLTPPTTIVLRGERDDLAAWQQLAIRHYMPAVTTLAIPSDVNGLPELLAQTLPANTRIAAFVCRGTHCEAPITHIDTFKTLLGNLGEQSDRCED
jgi:uncharacterized protein YyaL (SSP411 family)